MQNLKKLIALTEHEQKIDLKRGEVKEKQKKMLEEEMRWQ